ncbi:hypothetical protein [Oceanibaculum indicum]|uniref:Uncharacterized protein n=1 Tax=Oceanibaculum indicum TaxID=526216 RepID=A0A420WGH6_9PROT|nr:hypothetical protein [Oceanibaculum indicum]RKQ70124.1 hypothetical protein BCL74_2064 [Oceanibaculum indicum]
MRYTVKKRFPLSLDGIHSRDMTVGGDPVEIPASLAPGLLHEGFIAVYDEAEGSAAVDGSAGGASGADDNGTGTDGQDGSSTSGAGDDTSGVSLPAPFRAEHMGGKYWNVVNEIGVKQSDKALLKEDAEKLALEMNEQAAAGGLPVSAAEGA